MAATQQSKDSVSGNRDLSYRAVVFFIWGFSLSVLLLVAYLLFHGRSMSPERLCRDKSRQLIPNGDIRQKWKP